MKERIEFGPRGHPWGGPRYGEHMPFEGHRTVEQADRQSAAHRRAMQFGFDPASLRAKKA